jgi:hypothetical protein
MAVRIIDGDCLASLAALPAGIAQTCVTSPRNSGQFRKGVHAYRQQQPHWSREWLVMEYETKARSTGDIAREIGCTDCNVLFWLRKHGIPRRSVSAARALKHWGATGEANPMHGKVGASNPRYVDGTSPERQRMYAQGEGRAFLRAIYARDKYRCVRCGASKAGPRSLHVHHLAPWAGNPSLRFAAANAVTLCRLCHHWVHSKANGAREFLR